MNLRNVLMGIVFALVFGMAQAAIRDEEQEVLDLSHTSLSQPCLLKQYKPVEPIQPIDLDSHEPCLVPTFQLNLMEYLPFVEGEEDLGDLGALLFDNQETEKNISGPSMDPYFPVFSSELLASFGEISWLPLEPSMPIDLPGFLPQQCWQGEPEIESLRPNKEKAREANSAPLEDPQNEDEVSVYSWESLNPHEQEVALVLQNCPDNEETQELLRMIKVLNSAFHWRHKWGSWNPQSLWLQELKASVQLREKKDDFLKTFYEGIKDTVPMVSSVDNPSDRSNLAWFFKPFTAQDKKSKRKKINKESAEKSRSRQKNLLREYHEKFEEVLKQKTLQERLEINDLRRRCQSDGSACRRKRGRKSKYLRLSDPQKNRKEQNRKSALRCRQNNKNLINFYGVFFKTNDVEQTKKWLDQLVKVNDTNSNTVLLED